METIKLFFNETLAGEGSVTDEKDLLPSLKIFLKAINGIPGARIEIQEGEPDEQVKDFKSRLSTAYTMKGVYYIGSNKASVSMEIKAVSEEEAIEKARNLGLIDPYLEKHCDENDYQDEEEPKENEEDEENRKVWDRIEHEVCGDCPSFHECLWRQSRSGCRWR